MFNENFSYYALLSKIRMMQLHLLILSQAMTLKHQQLQQNTQSLDQKLISQKNNTSNLENSQRHSISDIAQEVKQRYGSIDTGNVCDICKKTKFSNGGVGHVCFSCKSSCCVRCAFRYTTKTKVSLRKCLFFSSNIPSFN